LWFGELDAMFVILGAEVGVAEDLVGFADGLEFGMRALVAGVFIYAILE